MTKVYRNANGNVINIGEWDYLETPEEDPVTGEIILVEKNPLPEEVVLSDEEVVTGWDGGLYAADDPRRNA